LGGICAVGLPHRCRANALEAQKNRPLLRQGGAENPSPGC